MTDDTLPSETENRPDDHQQAVKACEHAVDALRNGDLSRGRSLLDEAQAAVERAGHDDTLTHRGSAFGFLQTTT